LCCGMIAIYVYFCIIFVNVVKIWKVLHNPPLKISVGSCSATLASLHQEEALEFGPMFRAPYWAYGFANGFPKPFYGF